MIRKLNGEKKAPIFVLKQSLFASLPSQGAGQEKARGASELGFPSQGETPHMPLVEGRPPRQRQFEVFSTGSWELQMPQSPGCSTMVLRDSVLGVRARGTSQGRQVTVKLVPVFKTEGRERSQGVQTSPLYRGFPENL